MHVLCIDVCPCVIDCSVWLDDALEPLGGFTFYTSKNCQQKKPSSEPPMLFSRFRNIWIRLS